MINVLAIGNSFSNNTTHYFHQAAQAAGIDVRVVNLYIGGCSLQRHWDNLEHHQADYVYELNGQHIDERGKVDIDSVVHEATWDHIISQQVSGYSGVASSYEPYATNLYTYLRQEQPAARLWWQQTWAYEQDSDHGAFATYDRDQLTMYEALTSCTQEVSDRLNLAIIPTGQTIQRLRQATPFAYGQGGQSLNIDGYHLTDYGKYAAALVWVKTLLETNVGNLAYTPEPSLDPVLLALIRAVVQAAPETIEVPQ
ncbi:DUF4886 domain-containing protein [Lacticaseibacillus jixiensis]|uniref:DUF4886 domain-containing protein n=1 Tax=Lacticaseibacillus jixiensis TaxID=3231926 RepID=UPI0036F31E6D